MNKAVIFDMNGVIVDDERFHQKSWHIFCERHGFNLSEDEFTHNIFGRRETDTIEYLFKREIPPEEMQKYLDERVTIAIDLFKPELAATEGVVEFIQALHNEAVPLAIATSARKPYTSFILDGLDIRKYFNAVVTAEDVTKGKPDPEIYISAAEELGMLPQLCVAIEDSVSGIKSAKAAGMEVVGITTTHRAEGLAIGNADKIIATFKDLKPEDLENLKDTHSSGIETL